MLDSNKITTTDYYVGGMKQKDLKIAETAQVTYLHLMEWQQKH
jgi:hypothetical protein